MKPKIFVPFDFSESADRALAWAAELQQTAGAGPIQMVHAINSRPAGIVDVSVQMLVPNEDEALALEGSMREAALRHGSEASAKVVIAPSGVGDIIVDAARAAGAELIVMGTHGRTGVMRFFLGSVAEHVLRHADCPVVTVRAARTRDKRATAGERRPESPSTPG
jgi:nucleotide-binding universal stress UspA family protein